VDVVVREIEGIHALRLTTAAHDGHDQLGIFVIEDDLRSQEIRSALIAAAEVDAVTALAVDLVKTLAARDNRRVGRGTLLRGKTLSAASTTTATSTSAPGRRARHGRVCRSGSGDLRRRTALHGADAGRTAYQKTHEGGSHQAVPHPHPSPQLLKFEQEPKHLTASSRSRHVIGCVHIIPRRRPIDPRAALQ
jgi:hypothetical protein